MLSLLLLASLVGVASQACNTDAFPPIDDVDFCDNVTEVSNAALAGNPFIVSGVYYIGCVCCVALIGNLKNISTDPAFAGVQYIHSSSDELVMILMEENDCGSSGRCCGPDNWGQRFVGNYELLKNDLGCPVGGGPEHVAVLYDAEGKFVRQWVFDKETTGDQPECQPDVLLTVEMEIREELTSLIAAGGLVAPTAAPAPSPPSTASLAPSSPTAAPSAAPTTLTHSVGSVTALFLAVLYSIWVF